MTDRKLEVEDGGSIVAGVNRLYKGSVLHIHTPERIRIRVDLGFNISVVHTFGIDNLLKLSESNSQDLLSCLVILVGGQSVLIDVIRGIEKGLYPSRIYALCTNPPEDVDTIKIGKKTWMCIGQYLKFCAGNSELIHPDAVKRDYLSRK